MRKNDLHNMLILILAAAVLSGLSACAPIARPILPVAPSPLPPFSTASLPPISPDSLPPLTHTPTAIPSCTDSLIETAHLPTERLPEPMQFRVYLPPCYAENSDKRYPVLYLLHGQTFTEDQWQRLGAPETADRLIIAGEVSPFIIVMPYNKSWKQPTEDKFGEALVEELIPYVDANYRTQPDRAARTVGGLSRGGGWAIHLGLTRPDLFAAFGAHSPVVFWADSARINDWLAAIPPESMPRIYLDIGDNDRELEIALWLEELLDQENIPHEWHLYPGYHEESYWQAHVEEYLRWYAAGWR